MPDFDFFFNSNWETRCTLMRENLDNEPLSGKRTYYGHLGKEEV